MQKEEEVSVSVSKEGGLISHFRESLNLCRRVDSLLEDLQNAGVHMKPGAGSVVDITEENTMMILLSVLIWKQVFQKIRTMMRRKSDDVDYSLVCEILNQTNEELAMQGKRIYRMIPAPSPPNFTKCFRFDAQFLAELLIKSRRIRSTEDHANDTARKRRQGTYASGGKPAKCFKFDAGGEDY